MSGLVSSSLSFRFQTHLPQPQIPASYCTGRDLGLRELGLVECSLVIEGISAGLNRWRAVQMAAQGAEANGGVQLVRRRGLARREASPSLIFSGGSLTVKWERRER